MTALSGFGDVAGKYDGFIFDLWGVLHDGISPFPGVIPCLRELRRAKRRIWLLSNAPRRLGSIAELISSMGLTPDLYDGLHTSGEETHLALAAGNWGRRCLHLGTARDKSLYDGLDIALAADPAAADFVLASGNADDPEEKRPLLEACAARGLPLVCANPDRVVHVGDTLSYCPGAWADIYEALGGKVTYFGKPHRAVYSRILKDMGVSRVLAVGDGMPTDIAGAAGMGLDSVLITGGIHRGEVAAEDFFSRYPYRPTYLLETLVWGE